MTPYLKKFDPSYGKVLLKIAKTDLNAAELLQKSDRVRKETTVYLVQQAIEKIFKAVICFHGKEVPMIHDIAGLLAALPKEVSRPPHEEALDGLTEYATVRRYEEGHAILTDEEVLAAINAGRDVADWASSIISLSP